MISKLKGLLKGEGGITGLETAIILIAFVVVAAVFAFTVLSAGIFSSEKGKEAVYSGLEKVGGSVEIRGSVVARGITTTQVVSDVIFTISNVAGGAPLDLTTGDNRKLVIDYRDQGQRVADIPTWTKAWKGYNDGDDLLEEGELAEITVPITGVVSTNLGINTTFQLDLKPPQGGTVIVERTTPAYINVVMDLK